MTAAPPPPDSLPPKPEHPDGFWLHRLPGHRIRRLHQRLIAEFNALVLQHPEVGQLTSMQFAALAGIAHRPGSDQATIARLIGCDKVTAGQLFDRMEERGWIERTPDPSDRRARALTLSDAGLALLARVRPMVEDGPMNSLPPLTPSERAVLMTLLARLTMPLDP